MPGLSAPLRRNRNPLLRTEKSHLLLDFLDYSRVSYDVHIGHDRLRNSSACNGHGIGSAMNILEKIKDLHDRVFDAIIDGARKLVGKAGNKPTAVPVRVDPSDKQPPPDCRR